MKNSIREDDLKDANGSIEVHAVGIVHTPANCIH